MNRIHPSKLRHSKWTAVTPKNKEKHFLVTEVDYDDEGNVIDCVLEAIMTKQQYAIDWQDLKDTQVWKQGWV
ncbi:TIGR02450 family Trp-rich protein [Vibrio zhugei]|uniref:TIGR02450 family Trp-rich protein n=1 Tax=Vibrio zhugei TaxID=2479546 RepID=A0ABV7CDD8_9VIBR|nr:TIGR02450 family Trp-rich protein [Vibrio zhugei]